MVKILSWFILTYKKLLSPLLGQHCRFYPSCSTYCLQAIETNGAMKGSWLGIKRICRCHPLNAGGVDMVPGYCEYTAAVLHDKDLTTHGY
jgi:putative membrane protein insertion efficiency factor